MSYSEKKEFTTVDFCAGIGGIRIGFENAGFKTIFSNDYEQKCKETYDINFSNALLTLKNITEILYVIPILIVFVVGGVYISRV